MTNNSEWQEANRRLMAEQREKLGEPPTAEEMLAYSRGELDETEEERIRDLLVAYPELARMYAAPFPEEAEAGVSDDRVAAGFEELRQRLGGSVVPLRAPVRRYLPTTIAAALALLFFGLFVQAESRARNQERGRLPYILGAPQVLNSDPNRGVGKPTPLSKDGEAYLLQPYLINQPRYPHYSIELNDAGGVVWTSHAAEAAADDSFQIVIPHDFLRAGGIYQLRIFGIDGEMRQRLGSYDMEVPEE
ncbi:MAG TPA: hypothetical protein VEK57_28790 [Thermoanaerobaculia bacterium]|nr:hypothetical protein [Thermoanaerobaculia bacterium]